MSPLSHRLVITASQVRSIAIAVLLSTTMLVGPTPVAHADSAAPAPTQLPQTTPPQAGVEASDAQVETVEQRITHLHAALKITAEQEKKWDYVAQAMRENASAMQKLIAEKTVQPPKSMTAVEDLKSYEKFTQAHADGLKNLISSFEGLYDIMNEGQKKNADDVFQNFGRKGTPSHT